jgi:predicted ferric reductase
VTSARAEGRTVRLRPVFALAGTLSLNALFWTVSLATTPGPWPAQHVGAEFLSTSALLIASTNLLLATRAKPFEDFYGGLDKVFVSHRLNGLTVATLLSAHFLLMPESAGWVPSKLVGYPTLALLVTAVLIAIAPRAPWRRLVPLRYQDWKLSHRFQGLIIASGVTHSLLAHPFVLALPLMRVWVYGVASLGLAAYVFRETLEPALVERHRYRVGEPVHVAEDVLEIPLEPAGDAIVHEPGQFAFVRFEGGPTLEQHPFTISSGPSAGRVRFSVKASGDYTRDLQDRLDAGSLAHVEGPYGRFGTHAGGPRQLWLAGGIGVTPFLAMLSAVGEDIDIRFVWTVHARSDAIYLDEIGETLSRRPRIDFTLHATDANGRLRLTDLRIERPEGLSVFICGPVPMRDSFIGQSLAMGVRRHRIHYEEFSLR